MNTAIPLMHEKDIETAIVAHLGNLRLLRDRLPSLQGREYTRCLDTARNLQEQLAELRDCQIGQLSAKP